MIVGSYLCTLIAEVGSYLCILKTDALDGRWKLFVYIDR